MPNIQVGTCCFSHPVNQDGYIRVKQNINPRYQLFQLKTVMDSIMFVPIIIHISTEHWTKKIKNFGFELCLINKKMQFTADFLAPMLAKAIANAVRR